MCVVNGEEKIGAQEVHRKCLMLAMLIAKPVNKRWDLVNKRWDGDFAIYI